MKVGLFIRNLEETNPSGASFEQAILREFSELSPLDLDIYVFTYSDVQNINKYKNIKYINIHSYEINIILKLLFNILYFICILFLNIYKSGKVSILKKKVKKILSRTPLNKALIENNIRLAWHTFSTEKIDIPYIYGVLDCNHWIHSYQPEFAPSSDVWLKISNNFERIIKQASYIVTSTQVLKKQVSFIHGIIEEKIKVIPFFTPELKKSNTYFKSPQITKIPKNYLFYPARIMSQKNHITVFEALKILKQQHDILFPLVITGSDKGNLDFIMQKAKILGIDDQIHYLGTVSFDELIFLYENAFALVYGSLNGPDNFPPLEAFSLECPVIASKLEGAEEQLEDAALLFEPTNEIELVNQIIKLYNNPNLREELINKGKSIAERRTAKKYVTELLNITNTFEKKCRTWDSNFDKITLNWYE